MRTEPVLFVAYHQSQEESLSSIHNHTFDELINERTQLIPNNLEKAAKCHKNVDVGQA